MLKSELFTKPKSQPLEDCEVRDSAHITPGSRGEHVTRIQEALRRLAKAGRLANPPPASENGFYGPDTARAVTEYKDRKDIRQPWQDRPDPIVGIRTIKALDQDMAALQPGPTPPPPADDYAVVPFNEKSPFLISRKQDDRAKSDLSTKFPASMSHLPLDVQVDLLAMRLLPTFQLELLMGGELLVGGSLGMEMGTKFNANTMMPGTGTIDFAAGGGLSNAVAGSEIFKQANRDVRDEITKALLDGIEKRKVVDYHDLAESRKVVTPPVFGFSFGQNRDLKVAIGSIQGADVWLVKFAATLRPRLWKATLSYDFFDHFGVDDSDTIPDTHLHGTPGQKAMWILQRSRRPGHLPFVSKTTMTTEVEGAL